MTASASVSLAINWLNQSDIRYQNHNSLASGGVNRGYDWTRRQYQFIYSEITGYAISTLVNAYRWTGDDNYLTLARQSADYVLRVQGKDRDLLAFGGIPYSLSLPSMGINHRYYSFDSAICLQGLLDLAEVTSEPLITESAEAIGNWLVNEMQLDSGGFRAVYDAEAESNRSNNGFFSGDDPIYGDECCLHAKHAIGLLKLGGITENPTFTTSAARVCDWVIGLQNEDGSFRASYRSTEVHSHPHCYATEGLLYAYYRLGEEKYLQAARNAARWLLKTQNGDGSLNFAYKRPWRRMMGRRIKEVVFPRKVSDATAQAVRIWLALYYIDNDPVYLEASQKAVQFLTKMQVTSTSDTNARGGFYYWPGYPVLLAWCTMFALHALSAIENTPHRHGYQKMMQELF